MAGGGPVPPAPVHPAAPGVVGQGAMLPYWTLYADTSNDPFASNYASAYGEFEVPLNGMPLNTPAELASKVLEAGNTGTHMAIVGLVRLRTAPITDLGTLQAYHRLTRFVARLGLPAMPFDDQGHAFLGTWSTTKPQSPSSYSQPTFTPSTKYVCPHQLRWISSSWHTQTTKFLVLLTAPMLTPS